MKYFSRRFTDDKDDTAVMHFLVFFTLHMTWECAFFWVCPTTPMPSAGTIVSPL